MRVRECEENERRLESSARNSESRRDLVEDGG